MTSDRRAYESRSSGPRWNSIVTVIERRFWERVQFFETLLTEGGYPPFTEPLTPFEQYKRLVAWRDAGDTRYWREEGAQKALEALSLQYGSPAPLAPPPPFPMPRIG